MKREVTVRQIAETLQEAIVNGDFAVKAIRSGNDETAYYAAMMAAHYYHTFERLEAQLIENALTEHIRCL